MPLPDTFVPMENVSHSSHFKMYDVLHCILFAVIVLPPLHYIVYSIFIHIHCKIYASNTLNIISISGKLLTPHKRHDFIIT